jgi:hypothetical protein
VTLYRLELRFWGRVPTIRHYAAQTPDAARLFATQDGHVVDTVRDTKTQEILWEKGS